jgi:putative endopeptidase
VATGVHIDPGLTIGENIADLGGLLIALDAYHASVHGKPATVINGLPGEQRFVMSYAQIFRVKARSAKLREAAVSDVHSAAKFRVLGVLPNLDGWYETFDVKPGDRRYSPPPERVRIWRHSRTAVRRNLCHALPPSLTGERAARHNHAVTVLVR